jgi:hypothetical protein
MEKMKKDFLELSDAMNAIIKEKQIEDVFRM